MQNEYLATENRILKAKLPARLRLSDPERAALAEIGSGWDTKRFEKWPGWPSRTPFWPGIEGSLPRSRAYSGDGHLITFASAGTRQRSGFGGA